MAVGRAGSGAGSLQPRTLMRGIAVAAGCQRPDPIAQRIDERQRRSRGGTGNFWRRGEHRAAAAERRGLGPTAHNWRCGPGSSTSPRAATTISRRAAASAARRRRSRVQWRWRGSVAPGTVYFFPPAPVLRHCAFLRQESKLSPRAKPGHGDEHGQNALQRLPVFLDRKIPVHPPAPFTHRVSSRRRGGSVEF